MSIATLVPKPIQALAIGCCFLGLQACGSNQAEPVGTAGSDTGGASTAVSGAGGGSPSIAGAATGGSGTSASEGKSFSKRVLAEGLDSPWEITWGPDQWLWLTERSGKRILRVRPSDGMRSVALEIDEVRQDGGQDGLLGLALQPRSSSQTDESFVFVAYSYDGRSGRRFKIRRYTYDETRGTLTAPLDVLSELPASSDHNGGRLVIGPDQKLYYTIGDQGENQFERKCNRDRAQDLPTRDQLEAGDYQTYQGKILRMNLDGSIPDDNPELNGVKSHVFSFGHRNAQGIVVAPGGTLFADEQGPKSDDELNRIEAGKNYGWPLVAGFQDDEAYVFGNWSAAPDCEQLAYSDYTLPASVPQQKETAWADPNFMPPLMTFYTVASSYRFEDPKCGAKANICWPTIAPSSLELYLPQTQALAGWSDALLITSLKTGSVYRVALSPDHRGVLGDAVPLFKTTNRYRDVAVNPDGRTFYVITDSEGSTQSVDGGATDSLEDPGSILEFKASD